MEFRTLHGKAALVTGGSSGLGRATANALAAAGADVAVLARGSADLQRTVEQVRPHGHRASAVVVDLADADAVEQQSARCAASWGVWTSS
jgi:NAD(P)-dependent dehydrogenase (short-subunit alcohol dehydrogenase family)